MIVLVAIYYDHVSSRKGRMKAEGSRLREGKGNLSKVGSVGFPRGVEARVLKC